MKSPSKALGLFSQVNVAHVTLASCLLDQVFSFVSVQEFSPNLFSNQALSAWDSPFVAGEFLPLDIPVSLGISTK